MTAWVLVVTAHPTLAVALTLQGEWEVVEDPEHVPNDARNDAIVVIDAPEGYEVRLPEWADSVRGVLLTAQLDVVAGWNGLVLERPYRLDDLMACVRQLAAGRSDPGPEGEAVNDPAVVSARRPPEDDSAVMASDTASEASVATVTAAEPSNEPVTVPMTGSDSALRDGSVPPDLSETAVVANAVPPPPLVVDVADTDPLEHDIASATRHVGHVRALIHRVPALASRRRLADVLAQEIAVAVSGLTVGIWTADPGMSDRLTHLGGIGLTPGETTIPVRRTHAVVADALASGGTAIEHVADDPGRVSGLPASRHPTLLLAPYPQTPFGELLVIAGLPSTLPESAFALVDAAVAALRTPMEFVAALEELAAALQSA